MVGLGATGLAVARALGRRGYSVLGVDPRAWEIGRLSRYVNSRVSSIEAAMVWLGGRTPHESERPVLFACGDPELVVCDRAELAAHVVLLPAPSWLDKRTLYRRALDAGFDVPPFAVDAPPAGPPPWLAKPALAGAARTRPFAEKARLVQAVDPSWRDVLVQTWVPGSIEQVIVWAAHLGSDGSVGPTVTARKRREVPKFGSASWLETIRDLEVHEASLALCTALAIRGTVAIEWKRADRLWLIEVNARPVLWSAVAEELIVDAFQERRGAPRPRPSPVPSGRTWRYGARDPLAPRADIDALWAKDDPLPGLAGPAYTAALVAARATGRRFAW